MRLDTRLVRAGLGTDPATGAVSTPIHPSATFAHPGLGESTGYDYARTASPTRSVLETALADLEGATGAFAFSSGMAALTTLFLLFRPGDHLVVSEDLYGGTYRALEEVFRGFGLGTTYVDTSDTDAVARAMESDTRALLVEIPTNPLLKVADLPALADLARRREALLVVDSTFLTPCLHRPLELGAHMVVHSATKYLGGHNDLLAGVVATGSDDLSDRVGWLQNTTGAVLDPMTSWLLLRSLKTLHVRMERQCATALALAGFLTTHPKVSHVYYPGLPDHPGHGRLSAQASDFGAVVSFRLAPGASVEGFLATLEILTFAESLGGVETLVTVPSRQTHCDIPEAIRERIGVTDDLIRLSVGLEAATDLEDDLGKALGGGIGER